MRKSCKTICMKNILYNSNIYLKCIGACGCACILSWKGVKMYDFWFSPTLSLNNFLSTCAHVVMRPEHKINCNVNFGSETIMQNGCVVEEISAVENGCMNEFLIFWMRIWGWCMWVGWMVWMMKWKSFARRFGIWCCCCVGMRGCEVICVESCMEMCKKREIW